jgi:anti-sigma-K factor RskA
MSQDAIDRRAAALQSTTAAVDDPAEQAVLNRLRTLLNHPAAWAATPDFTLPPLTAGATDLAPEPAPQPAPAPAPRPARSPWRPGWRRRWVLAFGGLATAAAAVVLAIVVVGQPDRDTTRFDLAGTQSAAGAEASVTATRLDAGWHLTLTVEDLAPAAPGEYYEGWVVRDDGTHVPLGTFHMRQPGEVELWAGVDVREFDRLEITRQLVGGGHDPGEVMMEGPIPAR